LAERWESALQLTGCAARATTMQGMPPNLTPNVGFRGDGPSPLLSSLLRRSRQGAAPPAYVPQTSGLDGDRDRHHDRRGRGRDRDRQKAARLRRHDLRRAATRSTAITPDGRQLYAACGPSGAVSVIDTDSNTRMGDVTVGKLPWGVATGADARPPSASRDAVD
jgi:YVTN family beta-propeller protein